MIIKTLGYWIKKATTWWSVSTTALERDLGPTKCLILLLLIIVKSVKRSPHHEETILQGEATRGPDFFQVTTETNAQYNYFLYSVFL